MFLGLMQTVRAVFMALIAAWLLSLGCASTRVTPRNEGWTQVGLASWYGESFQGRRTASGEPFDYRKLTAAHRTLPFGTYVEVVRLDDDRRVVVRINDRGPFVRGRIIDLSKAAAEKIGMIRAGVVKVRIRVIANGQ